MVSAIIYGFLCLALSLIALACLWAAAQGAWKRQWTFMAGALFIGAVMAGSALEMWDGAHGQRMSADPDAPRLR